MSNSTTYARRHVGKTYIDVVPIPTDNDKGKRVVDEAWLWALIGNNFTHDGVEGFHVTQEITHPRLVSGFRVQQNGVHPPIGGAIPWQGIHEVDVAVGRLESSK